MKKMITRGARWLAAWTDLSLTADVTFRQLNRAEYAVPVSIRIALVNLPSGAASVHGSISSWR